MNTLKFKNGELVVIGNFFGDLRLKNIASLGRSKLIKLIVAKNNEYQDDLNQIRAHYFEKDESGNFKKHKDGTLVYKQDADKNKATAEVQEAAEDYAVISVTEYSNKFKKLYQALQEYDGEFDNQSALLYEVVMDAFDECFTSGKEE